MDLIPQSTKDQINRLSTAIPPPLRGEFKGRPISFSGSDIICLIAVPQTSSTTAVIEIEDKLQTITVTSARSIMPVRRLGETSPIAYTRGSRTIAGSMVFTTGLRDAFLNYFANKSKDDGEPISEPTIFVDQIPRFDMVFQGLNEVEGIVSQAILRGVTLTNFGTTFSIDDIYTESTFTYVAEEYFPLSIEKDRSHALRRAGKQSTQDIILDAESLLYNNRINNNQNNLNIYNNLIDKYNNLINKYNLNLNNVNKIY